MVTVYLKKDAVENRSQATNDYDAFGDLVNQYRFVGQNSGAGTWTVEWATGTTVCPRCSKTVNHPATVITL